MMRRRFAVPDDHGKARAAIATIADAKSPVEAAAARHRHLVVILTSVCDRHRHVMPPHTPGHGEV